MAYKALYRTYRPSTFDEVVGQQHIVTTIKNALKTGKIAHAYLFAGPKGTGKTSMARLLAKALNCEHGVGEQCNECKNCKSINEGNHPDVLEIDGASNNGVDEIRDLIDKVKYGTILGKYKIYIIDEVHMITSAAFNALLKTLEEPPEHVIFILATTEPHKILPTILSRCQRYDFSKISDKDIKERLKLVLEKEKIEYNDDAVSLITTLADGGMRDALSILDQVLAYSQNKLIKEDILDMFALESKDELVDLSKAIINSDIPTVLNKINKYVNKGSDIKRLTENLLDVFKDILIFLNLGETKYTLYLEEKQLLSLANNISSKEVIKIIDALLQTSREYKNVASISALFEITLLKLCTITKKEDIVSPVSKKEEKIIKDNPQIIKPNPSENVIKSEPEPLISNNDIASEEPIIFTKAKNDSNSYLIDDENIINVFCSSTKEMKDNMNVNWQNIKTLLAHPKLGKAASLILDSHLLVASKKIIILELPFQKNVESINLKENQKDIQNIIKTIFNKKAFVYAITRNESIRLQGVYMNKMQIGKLPKAKEITLEFEGE